MAQRQSLLNNSRFYILCGSLLLSGIIFAWLRITIANDQLFYIRSQQIFGLLCIVFWYGAMIISPLGYVIGKQRMKHIEFSRRAIGVSAFYFAVLHGGIALWAQLGGLSQLQYLPELFRWSLVAGAGALLILGVMAATSFDVVVKYMTPKRWKLLHRFVYGAGILVIIHIWSVGTHMAYSGVQIAAFVAIVVLLGLEFHRLARVLNDKYFHLAKTEAITIFITMWALGIALVLAIPALIQNYHSAHESHASLHSKESQ
ncbi:MAG: ferric reductase-like transmembrane domain-containing protein [Candidatus Microsaccharimonas sp.]